jgi:hypothetical protein
MTNVISLMKTVVVHQTNMGLTQILFFSLAATDLRHLVCFDSELILKLRVLKALFLLQESIFSIRVSFVKIYLFLFMLLAVKTSGLF